MDNKFVRKELSMYDGDVARCGLPGLAYACLTEHRKNYPLKFKDRQIYFKDAAMLNESL